MKECVLYPEILENMYGKLLVSRCCNFFVNITVRLVPGWNILNNIIQNNSRPKPNYKIVYCSLKSILLRGIVARGDTKSKNLHSFFEER